MLPLNLDDDDEWEPDASNLQDVIFLKTKPYGYLQRPKSIPE